MTNWTSSKLKSFCTSKDTMKKTKRQPIKWDKAFENFISGKEFTSRLHKECLQLNKNINTPIKMGK